MVLEYLQYLPTNLCHCGVNVGHDIPIGKIHMNSPDVRSRQIAGAPMSALRIKFKEDTNIWPYAMTAMTTKGRA